MTRLFITALAGSLLFPVNSIHSEKPIYSVAKGTISVLSPQQKLIIHESENRWILKKDLEGTFQNLYYVQLAKNVAVVPTLKAHGKILEYFEDEFAVWEPKSAESITLLSAELHDKGSQCGAIQKLSSTPLEIDTHHPQPILDQRSETIEALVAQVEADNILETVKTLQGWGTRFHKDEEGVLTGEKLLDLYQNLVPDDREDVQLNLVDHKGTPQKSTIVRILGTENPEHILIVGSHLDSINKNDNSYAPGADDNASGTATNLEIFRVLMENNIRPRKTLEFHAYAAEEIGLVGSGEIAQSYKDAKKDVIAMVQFDMNGFSKDGKKKIYFVSNRTNKTLSENLENLVEDYVDASHGSQFLLFGSSDHASWNRLGFPVAFPTENPFAYNKKIHTSEDTTDNMNATGQMAEFAKLGVAYLLSYGGHN